MSKQNLKVKENWRHWTPELAKIFLRSGPEGKSHPSRVRVLSLLQGLLHPFSTLAVVMASCSK